VSVDWRECIGVQGGTACMVLTWAAFARLPSVSHWLMLSVPGRLSPAPA